MAGGDADFSRCGFSVFAQDWAIAPGVNHTGIVLSTGLRIRFGS